MKLVINVCLSPLWEAPLNQADHDAAHWSKIGPADAHDHVIMKWAREHDRIVFTHDLDFSAVLAATQADNPLNKGAIVTVDPIRARVHLLPL